MNSYCKGAFVSYIHCGTAEIGKVIAFDCGEYVIENCENGRKSNVPLSDIIGQV